jgi:hypothetical protein
MPSIAISIIPIRWYGIGGHDRGAAPEKNPFPLHKSDRIAIEHLNLPTRLRFGTVKMFMENYWINSTSTGRVASQSDERGLGDLGAQGRQIS